MYRPLLILCLASVLSAAKLPRPAATAHEIIECALLAADEDRAARPELAYRFEHLYVKHQVSSGQMREERRDRYRVVPRDGEHRFELIETGGKPATKSDLAREERLRQKFRRQTRSAGDRARGRTGFEFDRELVDRYHFRLDGVQIVEGRSAWVLNFDPKSDDLPVDRRVDYALNHLTGKMYFDQEDGRPVRVEFRLASPVKVWQGLLGSVRQLEGRLDFIRLEPGLWMPKSMTLYSSGRMLFESLNQQVEMTWSDFQLVN